MASVEGAIDGAPKASLLITGLAALGIVFGDIGTSPLYTFKTILNLTGSKPDTSAILGSLSLVLWTLFIITTVKYVSFAMRVDNDGEGKVPGKPGRLDTATRITMDADFSGKGEALPARSPVSASMSCRLTRMRFREAIRHLARAVWQSSLGRTFRYAASAALNAALQDCRRSPMAARPKRRSAD